RRRRSLRLRLGLRPRRRAIQATGQFLDAGALGRVLLGGGGAGGQNDGERQGGGGECGFHGGDIDGQAVAGSSDRAPQAPGRSTQKVAPRPGAETTPISPPCSSISRLARVRPTPCPSLAERSRPRRLNGSNSWACFSSERPGPRSITSMRTRSPRQAARMITRPPEAPYLTALLARLPTTWV